jgi:hypothetical protein
MIVNSQHEQCYVFVEPSESPSQKRIEQWQAVAHVQGYVALCATTGASRQVLLNRASAAGLMGRITDLENLRDHLKNTLWAEQWPALQSESGN